MRTLNLSGFKPADSLSISVSQGAITAGPYSVPAWGGGGGGGTIGIDIIARSGTQIAPESLLFGVDLSAATFDAPAPVGDEVYDYRMHDLEYFWDFDDPGTWDHLVNVLSHWKDRNTARGACPTHLYRNPGDYTVSLFVVEPATGKTASATLGITILDPDAHYVGTDTICINNVGDSDFSGKPTGAAEINVDALLKLQNGTTTAEWLAREGGNAKRWLFKRGGDFDVSIRLDGDDTVGVTFGAYGTGNDPILRTPSTTASSESVMFTHSDHYSGTGDGVEIRLQNLDCRSTHDPTTVKMDMADPGFKPTNWFVSNNATQLIAVDCQMDGFAASTLSVQDSGSSTTDRRIHLDGCQFSNTGGFYPVIVTCENGDKSYFSFTGVSLRNPPDSYADQPTSMVRLNSARYSYVKGLEIFQTEAYDCFGFLKGSTQDGYIGYIEGYYAEGGDGQLGITTNVGGPALRPRVHNTILDGACLVGAWNTQRPVYIVGTGFTMRNVLIYQPSRTLYVTRPRCAIEIDHLRSGSWTGPLPSYVTSAPIKCYNCTWRSEQDLGSPNTFISTGKVYSDFTAVSEENNVIHLPNNSIVPVTTWAPLTNTLLFTPYSAGRRDVTTGVYDTDYASSPVLDSKPDTGSAALGAATTGSVSYMDILGTTRAAPADKGAWEVA